MIQQALNILIRRLLKDFNHHPSLLVHRTDVFQPQLQRWISIISRGYCKEASGWDLSRAQPATWSHQVESEI